MRRALQRVAKKGHSSSWPGKSVKRIFAQDDPAIHAFLVERKQDVDARVRPGHDECCEVGEH
jgi:hypothetical protein